MRCNGMAQHGMAWDGVMQWDGMTQRMEWNGTERNGTERNGKEADGTGWSWNGMTQHAIP